MNRIKPARPVTPHHGKTSPAEQRGVFGVDRERVSRGRAALPPDSELRGIAETFKVLAHPTRVKMIRALAGGELCVCEIAEVIGLSVSATSHQLHQLRDLRIVRSRSEGKLVHYSLQAPFVVGLLDDCACHISDRRARA